MSASPIGGSHDIAVIGAGIVGLATARALARNGHRVLVLEAEARVASHQTGNNSGVIHSGLYYRPGSRKAVDCVAGRTALLELLDDKQIPYELCGKVVVATDESQRGALDRLYERGLANGLDGLERLTGDGLREREPHVRGVAGLWVPQTGIVDYRAVAAAFADDIEAAGGQVATDTPLTGVVDDGGRLALETPAGGAHADTLVNCGGLQCDRVARRCGLHPKVRIVPFRGEYYRVVAERSSLVNNLIYPVPDPRYPFLGVHYTRRIDGMIECGPNAVLALRRHGYRWRDVSPGDLLALGTDPAFWRMAANHWRTGVTETYRSIFKSAFVRSLQELIPEIRAEDLVRHGAGVRAQAVDDDGSLLDDFHIERTRNQVHVLNAPSPAATASLAIGAHIARVVAELRGEDGRSS